MGHEEYGLAIALPQFQHHDVHVVAGNGIECAEGLVHEQDTGIGNERAAKRDPLPHAAGELARALVGGILEMDEPQEFHCSPEIGRTPPAQHLDRE